MRLKYWYLRIAYFLGFKAHVYHHISAVFLPDPWAKRCYDEAWEYQKVLIAKGWFECPSCKWATKKRDEHILDTNGYCYDHWLAQEQLRMDNGDPELDRVIRESLDRVRHECRNPGSSPSSL